MDWFILKLILGSIYWQVVICKLHLTNELIEDKLSPSHHHTRDNDHLPLLQEHEGPRSAYKDIVISSDISRRALNEIILDKVENLTKLFNRLDEISLDPSNLDQINEITLGDRRSYLSAIEDMTSLFTSSFVCAKTERQFSYIRNNTARVCCNNRSGATRTCKSHRCICAKSLKYGPSTGTGTGTGGIESKVCSERCCATKKSQRFCSGSLSEVVDLPSIASSSCSTKNTFINVKSNNARVCCVATSACTQMFPCMKIVKRTSVQNKELSHLCCQSYINRFFYCTSQSSSQPVIQPTSSTPSYGGPVNPGYYAKPPPPSPPPPQPQPVNPGVYPPPQPQTYVPYVRPVPVPGRVCQYSRVDLADSFSNVTDKLIQVSKKLHYLRDQFVLESPQLMENFNIKPFSEVTNQLVMKISQFKEKQALIRRSNKNVFKKQ